MPAPARHIPDFVNSEAWYDDKGFLYHWLGRTTCGLSIRVHPLVTVIFVGAGVTLWLLGEEAGRSRGGFVGFCMRGPFLQS